MKRFFSVKKDQELINITREIELSRHEPSDYEVCSILPSSMGFGTMREIRLKEGITLFIEDLNPKETFISSLAMEKYPVRFLFMVCGEVLINDEVNGISYLQPRGESRLSFTTSPVKGSMEKEGGKRTTLITLLVDPGLLHEMIGDDADTMSDHLKPLIGAGDACNYQTTLFQTVEVEEVLDRIMTCPYTGLTRRLFLESKALELIALVLDSLDNDIRRTSAGHWLNSGNLGKIYLARDILKQRMVRPPGIFELAQEVGLSHTKLNRGFRELFDTTVFAYLKRLRIDTARRHLESGDMNVTDAAYSVGYSSLSHFSLIFKQYMGVNPSEYVRNERKRRSAFVK